MKFNVEQILELIKLLQPFVINGDRRIQVKIHRFTCCQKLLKFNQIILVPFYVSFLLPGRKSVKVI